jgi:para-aminobenzoate synthetase component I
MAFIKHKLNYHTDSAHLFARIQHLHWPMLLDSGQAINPATGKPGSQFGRYDILVANPVKTIVTRGLTSQITHFIGKDAQNIESSQNDPFTIVSDFLKPYTEQSSTNREFPFSGGALGYFGYDLGRRIEALPAIAQDDMALPEMMIGLYDWAIIVDHKKQVSWLVSHQFFISDEVWQSIISMLEFQLTESTNKTDAELKAKFAVKSHLSSNFTEQSYGAAFDKVQRYITQGDCYQINLAQRFSAPVDGDSWVCFLKLREISPAPFMAYMRFDGITNAALAVLSASPERFLQLIDGNVETRPIKGTRPRSDNPGEDLNNAIDLVTSFKDRAENVMIVDLLRNDIGKVCKLGSVKAEQLFNLQSFANVHHLVSYVTGQMADGKTALDLLRSCFPGGSITGAPKLRAMEIIEELEPNRRAVYCGAIGYINYNGDMDTNIAIRTAVVAQSNVYFYAGGGVVVDSTVEKEYKETLDKASNFLTTMQFFMRN